MFLDKLKVDPKTYESGTYNRLDGRTRCVFDNGTESNMLYRSLEKAMNIDGFCISEPIDDKPTDRIRPDYIAHRKVCKDFSEFKKSFDMISYDLEHGRRKLVEYRRGALLDGHFYVLRGVTFLLMLDIHSSRKRKNRRCKQILKRRNNFKNFSNDKDIQNDYLSLDKRTKQLF